MILFWVICAAMVAIALAFILPPLLGSAADNESESAREANVAVYRHQITELEADLRNGLITETQFQADKDEIERRLLEDVSSADLTSGDKPRRMERGPVYAIALAIPLIAVGMYLKIGNANARDSEPAAAAPGSASAPASADSSGPMSQQRIEANVSALAKRLEQNPNDAQGWSMLGRSYVSMERYADAANAFSKTAALQPNDADVLCDYAFALAMANGRQFQGQPQALINKALKIDPENPKALELAGSAAFAAKNYKDAVTYWQRLLDKAPPGTELAQSLSERIEQAKSLGAR